MNDLWRIWRAAAVSDARALRLLPLGTKCKPTDLQAAIEDAEYLEYRQSEIERARRYRATKKREIA